MSRSLIGRLASTLTSALPSHFPPPSLRRAMSIHKVASEGFNIGDFYNASRPSYPIPALEHIHQIASKTPAKDLEIVEHGAGTGLFTKLLTAPPPGYPTFPIARLTALEPSESMRAAFDRAVLPSTKANVRCLSGTFSAFPPEVADGSVDMLVIAQAFHWSDPDYEASIAAIGKALKQDGVAVFIWNMEDEKAAPWVRQLRALYQEHEAGSPQYRLRLWEAAFQTPSYKALFAPAEHTMFQYSLPCTSALALDRAFSKSYTSVLDDQTKAALKAAMEAVLEKGEGMELMEADGAAAGEAKTFRYPYETEVVVMRRK